MRCLRSCKAPSFFSKTVLFLILSTWLLVAFLTSYLLLLKQNYKNNSNGTAIDQSWVLLGSLTATTINFRIRGIEYENFKNGPDYDVSEKRRRRLVVTTDQKFEEKVFEEEFSTEKSTLVHSVTATGLTPSSLYYYAIFDLSTGDDVIIDNTKSIVQPQHQGQFTTAPTEGNAVDFQIIASACSWTGSDAPVYTEILEKEILTTKSNKAKPSSLLFLNLGDFHYEDLNVDSLERRVHAIDHVFSSTKQRRLWANVPLASMWDDHDWLGNNADGDTSQIGYQAAQESYRVIFPHYELPSSLILNNSNSDNNDIYDNRGVYQAFTIGTVRFIMSDLRSEASESSIYTSEQREWLFKELEDSTKYDFVVWISTRPWIATAEEGSDTWGGFPRDRRELSLHIEKVVTKKNLLVLSADAHMVAFDDGMNTFYGDNDKEEEMEEEVGGNITTITTKDPKYTRSFPILQTGPLDRLGSIKGGPFSDGCHTHIYERNHQFSVIRFQLEDRDKPPCLTINSYDHRNLIFTKELCGPDIFGNSRRLQKEKGFGKSRRLQKKDESAGSCKAKYFSSTNMILIGFVGVLLFASFLLSYFVFVDCCISLGMMMLILIFSVATFAAGFFVPVFLGIKQYEAFETILICVIQISTVDLYLIAWKFCSNKDEYGK